MNFKPSTKVNVVVFRDAQVALLCFATYVLSSPDNILDAQTAFVSMSLINLLNFPMTVLPASIMFLVQVSLNCWTDLVLIERSLSVISGLWSATVWSMAQTWTWVGFTHSLTWLGLDWFQNFSK
jgi:hypothetical protein